MMTDAAHDKKVRTQLAWILSLSLLILTFIFFRIDYTDVASVAKFVGYGAGSYYQAYPGGPYGGDADEGDGDVDEEDATPDADEGDGDVDEDADEEDEEEVVVCYDKPGGGTYTCQTGEGCCGGSCKTEEEKCCTDGIFPDNKYTCWKDQGCCNGCLDKAEEQCCYNYLGVPSTVCSKDETCCGLFCAGNDEKCCKDGPGDDDPDLQDYLCKSSEDCCGGDCVDTTVKKCCGDGPYGGRKYGCLISDCCNDGGCAGAGSICDGGGTQACSYCSGGGCTSITCQSCEKCAVKNGVVQCVGCLSNCEYCEMGSIDPSTMQAGVCIEKCNPPANPCSTCEITPANPNGQCVSTCSNCAPCYTQYDQCVDKCGGTDGSCYCGAGGSCVSCASVGYVCKQVGSSKMCKPEIIYA